MRKSQKGRKRTMTKEECAKMLDGREMGEEVSQSEAEAAKESGLVIIYGASDDLMEFEGAIRDEVGCCDGGTAYLDETGLFSSECENEGCPYAEREQAKCKTIEAVWCPPCGGTWAYETEIPHATFKIYEDGELYCTGIVFDLYRLG